MPVAGDLFVHGVIARSDDATTVTFIRYDV